MKNHKLGRPIEYAEGTKKLTATIPTELYAEFERRMKDLGQKNLSRMVTDALRVWISSRSALGSLSTAVLVELPLKLREFLSEEASSLDVSLGALLTDIAADHMKNGTKKLLKAVKKAL